MTTPSHEPFPLSVAGDIEYLLRRKFPGSKAPPPINSGPLAAAAWEQQKNARDSYRTELVAMSGEGRAALVRGEREREIQAIRARAEAEERQRPFNQPHAMADLDHWSKCAHWTLEEALALSFGRSPKIVSWDAVRPYESVSPLAHQYSLRRDLAMRALEWKQLFDPVLPGIFLAWAKRMDMDLPATLLAKVEARGGVADWQSLFEKSEEVRQTLSEALDHMTAAKDSLRGRVTELETAVASAAEMRARLEEQGKEIVALKARLDARWPWGDYETKLLRHLAAAAERFWKLYEPADATTAPTNEQVKDWLKGRDVADRVAEIMAQILRADGLRLGPRT